MRDAPLSRLSPRQCVRLLPQDYLLRTLPSPTGQSTSAPISYYVLMTPIFLYTKSLPWLTQVWMPSFCHLAFSSFWKFQLNFFSSKYWPSCLSRFGVCHAILRHCLFCGSTFTIINWVIFLTMLITLICANSRLEVGLAEKV